MGGKRLLAMLIVLLIVLPLPMTAYANSAEPPGMIILVSGGPEDLRLTLEFPDPQMETHRTYQIRKAWERRYQFYYHVDMESLEAAVLRVESGDKCFTCPLPAGVDTGYKNILTLDYYAETLTLGQSPWRQPLLTAMRIILTLAVEGFVFWLFRYQQKRSWIVFIAMNLLTQGWLNIVVNSYAFAGGYWVIMFGLMEFCIFAVEMIALPFLLEEKSGLSVLYALVANALSLLAGIFLLGQLPL